MRTHTYTNTEGAPPPNTSHPVAVAKGGKQELRCTAPPLKPKAHNQTCARHLESRHSVSPQVLSLNHTPLRCESQPAITAHGGNQELRYTEPPLKLSARDTTYASHLELRYPISPQVLTLSHTRLSPNKEPLRCTALTPQTKTQGNSCANCPAKREEY